MTTTKPKPSLPGKPTAPAHSPAAVAPTCLTCRFYLIAGGLCRRFPPVVIGGPTAKKNPDGSPVMTWANVFPGMQAQGWCGEWTTP